MRKLFIATWSIAACLLTVGFLYPAAYDVQVSRTTWFQVANATGALRIMTVRGDPSPLTVAATVFEREKGTWRNVVSGNMWGRYDHWLVPVDEPGTLMHTYRLDFPLAWVLILLPLLRAGWWAVKRYRAPPRLIWKELRVQPLGRGRLARASSLFILTGFFAAAIAVLVLRSATYSGLPRGPSYFRDWGAFVLPLEESTDQLWDGPLRAPTLAGREQFEKSGSANRYVSIDVLRGGSVAFRYFTATVNWSQTPQSWRRDFAGFMISTMPTPGPRVLGYTSSDYISRSIARTNTWKAFGVERSVLVPFWSLTMLILIYPFIRFFRGPLRRARWRTEGRCRLCGYDLTGNESGFCSECGNDTKNPT